MDIRKCRRQRAQAGLRNDQPVRSVGLRDAATYAGRRVASSCRAMWSFAAMITTDECRAGTTNDTTKCEKYVDCVRVAFWPPRRTRDDGLLRRDHG
jgi:hypothetical protein